MSLTYIHFQKTNQLACYVQRDMQSIPHAQRALYNQFAQVLSNPDISLSRLFYFELFNGHILVILR